MGFKDWFTTSTRLEKSAVDRSVWPEYSTSERLAYGVGLTVLSWALFAGSLLLIGANGRDFWIVFLAGGVLFGGLFATLASGRRSWMRETAKWLRGITTGAFLIAGLLGVASLVLAAIRGG